MAQATDPGTHRHITGADQARAQLHAAEQIMLAVLPPDQPVHQGQDLGRFSLDRLIHCVPAEVAFGAFFPTSSKEPPEMADIETLRLWAEVMEIPCVAIGGITAENCAPLVKAGAEFLAVVGAVWNFPSGPEAGVRAMLKAIEKAVLAAV